MFDVTIPSIAVLHAVPVLLVGLASRSRVLLLFAALVSGAVGIVYADPRHVLANLAAVAIGWILAFALMKRRAPHRWKATDAALARAQGRSGKSSWIWNLVGLAVVGSILYSSWKVDPLPAPGQRAVQQARGVLQAGAVRGAESTDPRPAGRSTREGRASRLPRDADMRHCLELKSADAIRACAERG